MSTSVSPLLSKRDLQRSGVVVRGQSEIAALLGQDGQLTAGVEADVPGVFAAGDVRSAPTKRCATAAGEGDDGRPVRARLSKHRGQEGAR